MQTWMSHGAANLQCSGLSYRLERSVISKLEARSSVDAMEGECSPVAQVPLSLCVVLFWFGNPCRN